jgi:MoaA/NifB/PqqE/SkfB family radical SAM enzyme
VAYRRFEPGAGRARPDELSTDQALDLIRQMRDLGINDVTMIGGEAYLPRPRPRSRDARHSSASAP